MIPMHYRTPLITFLESARRRCSTPSARGGRTARHAGVRHGGAPGERRPGGRRAGGSPNPRRRPWARAASASARVRRGRAASGSGTSGVRATNSANEKHRPAGGNGRPSAPGPVLLVEVEQLEHGGGEVRVRRVLPDRAGQPGERDHLGRVGARRTAPQGRRRWVTTRSSSGSSAARLGPGARAGVERGLAGRARAPAGRRRSRAAPRRRARPARAAQVATADDRAARRASRSPTGSGPAGASVNSAIRSAGFHQAVSMKTFGWSGSTRHSHARSEIAAWARISGASGNSPVRRTVSRPSAGMPRPAWMRIGTRRSCASATRSRTAGSASRTARRAGGA